MADLTPPETSHPVPAIRAFFRIGEAWGLTLEEKMDLLGMGCQASLQQAHEAGLNLDQVERISHILAIYRALRTLLPSDAQANAWVKRPNQAPLFEGRSALEVMQQGLGGLRAVRDYLCAQCGEWTAPGTPDCPVLSREDQEVVAEAQAPPPPISDAMPRALDRHREFQGEGPQT